MADITLWISSLARVCFSEKQQKRTLRKSRALSRRRRYILRTNVVCLARGCFLVAPVIVVPDNDWSLAGLAPSDANKLLRYVLAFFVRGRGGRPRGGARGTFYCRIDIDVCTSVEKRESFVCVEGCCGYRL